MTTDNFCFYLQNRLIQTKQEVNGTVILPPFSIPCLNPLLDILTNSNLVPKRRKLFFKVSRHFLNPSASGVIRTLDLRIMR